MAIRDKVLIIDGLQSRREALQALLAQQGCDCVGGESAEALSLCGSHCPDAVVMDAGAFAPLETLLDLLRRSTDVPILVLFGEDDPKRRAAALDAGADDCLVRPVDREEFLARLRRALRRAQTAGLPPEASRTGIFRTGDLTVDYRLRRVCVAGRDAGLTQREYRLVALLGRYAGRVLSYDFLARQLWGGNTPEGNQILRVNMTNIRRKLGEDPAAPRYLFTHPGQGYRMAAGEGEEPRQGGG